MVKSGTAVVSSTGTAATSGLTCVTIQSSTPEGGVGVLPSSSPGEGATGTPEGDGGSEFPALPGTHPRPALLEEQGDSEVGLALLDLPHPTCSSAR
jgi:hypothetical protein